MYMYMRVEPGPDTGHFDPTKYTNTFLPTGYTLQLRNSGQHRYSL